MIRDWFDGDRIEQGEAFIIITSDDVMQSIISISSHQTLPLWIHIYHYPQSSQLAPLVYKQTPQS
jgi:hypothetical protein